MASEARQLPNTNISRLMATNAAKAKDTAMGGSSFLTAATKTRLTTIQGAYQTLYDVIAVKKQAMVTLTNQKNPLAAICKMFNSHFIQVFNLAVERGTFPIADRAFYKLDVRTGNVPEMITDQQITKIADDLIKGEADRVAAGGAAMSMPDIAQVNTAFTNLNAVLMPHSTAIDAYDQALENLDAQNTAADAVIKKVWDEVETFYNEEEAGSQRANAREWGVIYVLRGSTKTISGKAVDFDNNDPIAGARIFFANGNKTVIADDAGNYTTTTTLMNAQHLLAEADLYDNYDEEVTLVENENLSWDVKMKKSV